MAWIPLMIDYCECVGAAERMKYVGWKRLNCVSWMTEERIRANGIKCDQGGTNIDFVGIEISGTVLHYIKHWGISITTSFNTIFHLIEPPS